MKKQKVRRLDDDQACHVADLKQGDEALRADIEGRTILHMHTLELEFQKCGTSVTLVAADALLLAAEELKAELLRRLETRPKEKALLQVRGGSSHARAHA